MDLRPAYPRLQDGIYLKQLERPCVYDTRTDELYELSPEAMVFLSHCDGAHTISNLQPEEHFLAYCLEEGILELLSRAEPTVVRVGINELPSLRYLMVEVTERCNLRCRHCYLGEAGEKDMDPDLLLRLLDDLDDIGGLRLMITGGEPVLYPHFQRLNRALAGRTFRPVLITNGTLIDGSLLSTLNFREIQFSLDGLEEGHDFLRGKGSFRRTLEAVRETLVSGKEVSVATVLHRKNMHELEKLGRFLRDMGVHSWTLEYPVAMGRMAANQGLMPKIEEAAPFFSLEWGSGPHAGESGYACGAHLAAVDVSGRLMKCGYYRQLSGGSVNGGLRSAWRALPKMRLEGVCASCTEREGCGGGCRFRAELMDGPGGRDLLMCARLGMLS
ncbi:radical SAM protein [Candidatus Solincola tengchongensis]|uniref:radical SAM protein n=1 Tax=Candidatus Solincola tengchongensis TaxID=2900693 RepID=UPI00257C18BD|nr:radical SAM protein [Candidatus Solincola tengchongensis]